MTDAPIRHSRTVVFDEADTTEERLAAILFTRDADGNVRAYVKDVSDHPTPDPEIIALLAQGIELQHLT